MADILKEIKVAGSQMFYEKLIDMGDGTYSDMVIALGGGSIASDGTLINIDSLAQTLTYNGDGTLNYVQVVSGANTYRQTYTYTTGKVTAISAWVKQ